LSPMPTLRDLSIEMRNTDRRYVDYVSTLNNEQLLERIDFAFTDGAPGRMSREEMLMHVLTHGVGHRGQISALLLLNSITPVKDGFTTYLHNAEAIAVVGYRLWHRHFRDRDQASISGRAGGWLGP